MKRFPGTRFSQERSRAFYNDQYFVLTERKILISEENGGSGMVLMVLMEMVLEIEKENVSAG